jgi:5-methylcytosine-specific restriction endonuclease McrA
VYVLEDDRQAEKHDRDISDPVRLAVLQRDSFSCVTCGWNRSMLSHDDPRKFLELHHKKHHVDKGENTVENLETLCNVHHDEVHRQISTASR